MIDPLAYLIIVIALAFIGVAIFRPLRQRDEAVDKRDAAGFAKTEHRLEEIERAARRDHR